MQLTLNQIVTIHNPVLIDTSVQEGGSFSEKIKRKQKLKHKDYVSIKEETNHIQKFNEILQLPNTYTIPEVTQELQNYYNIKKTMGHPHLI